MNNARYPAQDVETDVDQQISSATSPDEDRDERKPNCDEIEENIAAAGLCARHCNQLSEFEEYEKSKMFRRN